MDLFSDRLVASVWQRLALTQRPQPSKHLLCGNRHVRNPHPHGFGYGSGYWDVAACLDGFAFVGAGLASRWMKSVSIIGASAEAAK